VIVTGSDSSTSRPSAPRQFSPDGRWFWDGRRWNPVPLLSQWTLPRWAWMLGGLWLVLIGVWLPVLLKEAITAKPPLQALPATGLLLGAIAVIASICWGLVLALLRRWRWILVSAAAGTAVLLGWYVTVMISTNINDPQVDNEAGADIAILSVPTLVSVGLLLSVGGGLGSTYRRLRTRQRATKSVAG
jgi:lysylphosphatidylglycerol synthetase-like protein (DUF2156 family)